MIAYVLKHRGVYDMVLVDGNTKISESEIEHMSHLSRGKIGF